MWGTCWVPDTQLFLSSLLPCVGLVRDKEQVMMTPVSLRSNRGTRYIATLTWYRTSEMAKRPS